MKWRVTIEGLGPDEEETYLKYLECFINGETLDEVIEKLDERLNFHDNALYYHYSVVE